MGLLTFYGTKNKHKKIPLHAWEYYLCMEQNKDKGKFPHVFHKQVYLHGIFPSIDREKHRSIGE
jgi:hypothetical protein